jgi:diadenylate cyclase
MPDFLVNLFGESGALGWFGAVLDLVIVFLLVYVTLLLIRGTRTVPMAFGLLVLVALYLFSQAMNLATTYMLLDQFMSVVVIFTLIIFQDDIRRALVRVGKVAWFSKARETQVVEEVIRAASLMAGKRIGALIVFERNASLDEFIIKRGTRVDAAVTRELLYSIFVPERENPLHDGAAIIGQLQIREAGAFLPLSANARMDKALGTRHRAAVGITEETDAVAVVVSEERGTISLCFDGRISRNLDAAALRKTLLGLFSTTKIRERAAAAEERKSKPPPQPPGAEGRGGGSNDAAGDDAGARPRSGAA